jgi:hypothetical protein
VSKYRAWGDRALRVIAQIQSLIQSPYSRLRVLNLFVIDLAILRVLLLDVFPEFEADNDCFRRRYE